ncbi:Dyp-type peroxidase [Rheinheimera soli]|uniref:Dyp-type peroxidase n=1 Tax=Rheinheimera soli TaxID=443616 RepID=UPI001E5A01B8|nr:Dyp-type peroxidase [Rheinheimera soli]
MAREQSGICAEANLHCCYVLLNALDGHEHHVRLQLAKVPMLAERLSDQFSEAMLNVVVAIGQNYWLHLYPEQQPEAWPDFADNLAGLPVVAPDLLIQIRADRFDVIHIATQQIYHLLQQHVDLYEQVHAFRYLDGRSLTGFHDAPDNPKGKQRRLCALISNEPKSHMSAGSYVYMLRYQYDLQRWQQLTMPQQEAVMGRNKLDGQLLASAQRQANSHADKTALENESGRKQILWQNMPVADIRSQGMIAVGFSANAVDIPLWLVNRLGLGTDNADLLLDYCQIEAGAAFFAPSINFLEEQAGSDLFK